MRLAGLPPQVAAVAGRKAMRSSGTPRACSQSATAPNELPEKPGPSSTIT